MWSTEEKAILTKWLEKRLVEYFARKAKRNRLGPSRPYDYDWLLSMASNQCSKLPIEALLLDIRILDLKLNEITEPENQENSLFDAVSNNNEVAILDDHADGGTTGKDKSGKKKALSWRDCNVGGNLFDQRNTHIRIVYQDGHCVGKKLHLYLKAMQLKKKLPPTLEKLAARKSYLLSLEERQVDVYTKVFFVLKKWVSGYKQADINISVADCYFGGYESEEESAESLSRSNTLDDDILIANDDIMSKVAAGMALFEKEKKKKELLNSLMGPSRRRSQCWLLVFEDYLMDGFKLRFTSPNSTFISLMNVREALKALAVIHSVSWAFAEETRQPLAKTWPFLELGEYPARIFDGVMFGYPILLNLVREYLTKRVTQKLEDNEVALKVLDVLRKLSLRLRLSEILQFVENMPRIAKCLIHQDASTSSFLFRYEIQHDKGNKTEADCNSNTCKISKEISNIDESSPLSSPKEKKGLGQGTTLKRDSILVNWQTATIGSPMIDVAMLLLTGLPPKTRRDETKSLLQMYWTTFQAHARILEHAFTYPSEKRMMDEYLDALLYTCIVLSGNIDNEDCTLNDEGLEIFVEAIKDLIEVGWLI